MTPNAFRRLALVLVAALGLAACDASEQNLTWEPGNELSVQGPFRIGSAAPIGSALDLPLYTGDLSNNNVYFYVNGFDRNKTYTWALNGETITTTSESEAVVVEFPRTPELGTYTITVTNSEGVSGSREFTLRYPALVAQLDRFSAFATLSGVIDEELAEELEGEGSFTILAPSNDAFLAALDADEDGEIGEDEMPDEETLAAILRRHVIAEQVLAADITDGSTYTTLSGDEVTFQRTGDQISVSIDGVQAGVIEPSDLRAENGVIHAIDAVLLPDDGGIVIEL